LSRRTRARLLLRDPSADAADRIAELMGAELGWDARRQAAEAEAYRASVAHERTTPDLPVTGLPVTEVPATELPATSMATPGGGA